jgi:tRNA G10  N-methylase Trm11
MTNTTHQLAKQLRLLASLLQSGPDVPMQELRSILDLKSLSYGVSNRERGFFSALDSLGKVSKRDLVEFIQANGIPLDFRSRDATRDILDKLIRFISEHPEAQKRLKKRIRDIPEASPLRKALDILLGE